VRPGAAQQEDEGNGAERHDHHQLEIVACRVISAFSATRPPAAGRKYSSRIRRLVGWDRRWLGLGPP
jgi:hypothetical protein